MVNRTISYHGSVTGQNVGDRAIYYANCKLFSEFSLVPSQYSTHNEDAVLFGGGTMLPRALRPRKNPTLSPSATKVALGIGVNNPEFYNQKKGTYDIRYWAGKRGINLKKYRSKNKLVQGSDILLSKALGEEFILNMEYFNDKHFELIKQADFDFISVRGPISKAILSRYGIEADVIGDPALYLEPSRYYDQTSNKILISLRRLGNDKWGDSSYVDKVVEACNTFHKNYDTNISFVFIPFNHKDIPLNRKTSEKVPNSSVYFTHHMQMHDILEEISTADVMIGERLHACVSAASCYVPFISLEYRPKNRDFAESVGMAKYNFNIAELKPEDIIEALFSIYDCKKQPTYNLKREVNNNREKINSFVLKVKKYL